MDMKIQAALLEAQARWETARRAVRVADDAADASFAPASAEEIEIAAIAALTDPQLAAVDPWAAANAAANAAEGDKEGCYHSLQESRCCAPLQQAFRLALRGQATEESLLCLAAARAAEAAAAAEVAALWDAVEAAEAAAAAAAAQAEVARRASLTPEKREAEDWAAAARAERRAAESLRSCDNSSRGFGTHRD